MPALAPLRRVALLAGAAVGALAAVAPTTARAQIALYSFRPAFEAAFPAGATVRNDLSSYAPILEARATAGVSPIGLNPVGTNPGGVGPDANPPVAFGPTNAIITGNPATSELNFTAFGANATDVSWINAAAGVTRFAFTGPVAGFGFDLRYAPGGSGFSGDVLFRFYLGGALLYDQSVGDYFSWTLPEAPDFLGGTLDPATYPSGFDAFEVEFLGDDPVELYNPTVAYFTPVVIPEPGTWALLGTGLVGIGLAARRRRTA